MPLTAFETKRFPSDNAQMKAAIYVAVDAYKSTMLRRSILPLICASDPRELPDGQVSAVLSKRKIILT